MSDPSARQVELDALRETNTVNSNAKALDDKIGAVDDIVGGGAAAAINMMDWQAQQKAMKEADRQSKSQSAQIRHNFKASGSFEPSALEGIKQVDREKQRLAQQQLHNYRAAFVGKDGSTTSSSRRLLEEALVEEDVTSGIHVEDAVAGLDKRPEVVPDIVHEGGTFVKPVAGAGAGAGEAVVEFAADEAAVEATTKNVEPVVEENAFSTPVAAAAEADAAPVVAAEEIPTPAAEEMVMVEKPEDFSGEEWVSVPPPLAPQPSKDEWGDMTVKHMNFDAAAAATVAAVEEPPPPTTPPLTVDFTFALVTLSAQPDVTKYLRAAAFIVGDESVVGPAQLKLAMQPQSNTVNQQRPGVYNHLVTASLALKQQQQRGASIESRQQHVLGLLKTAVQDGSFLAVASATP